MRRGILLLLLIPLLLSCQTGMQVKRIDTESDIDLSGRWNDTDIRLVSEALVEDSLAGQWIREYRIAHQGAHPTVIVGSFLNRSSEHIDTAIITKRYEMALINSGQVEMVADQAFRASVREERAEQQYFASEESAKALGKEIGADFLLQGAVRTNVDQLGNEVVRTYYVSAELIDIETNRKVWVGEETIKKYVKRPKYRF